MSSACDADPSEAAAAEDRQFFLANWQPLLAQIEAATEDMRVGQSMDMESLHGLRCSVFIEDRLFDVCVAIDHRLGQDPPCPALNPSYAQIEAQRSVELRLSTAKVGSMLFHDGVPGSGGTVCLQIYSSSDRGGTTCHYENCLAGGGMLWTGTAHDAVLDDAAPHLMDAFEDAGVPVSGWRALEGALLDMHETAVANVFAEDLPADHH